MSVARTRAMVEAALEHAERGVPIIQVWNAEGGRCGCRAFDCESPAKHPIASTAPNGLKNATTDPAIIRRWFELFPSANLAEATGIYSVVLDVDPAKGGRESLARLVAEHGPLPTTPKMRTGGGGEHYRFRPVPGLRNSAGAIGPGLDIRGEGGYALLSPSDHVSGGLYVEDVLAPMYETPLAPMPRWMVALALAPTNGNDGHHQVSAEVSADEWAARLEGAPEGQRRGVALQIAGHYLALGIAAAEVETILLGYAARCTPAFPEREARELVRDLARRERAKGTRSASPSGMSDDGAGRSAVIVPAATITPERIEWLWPGRLAVGALTNAVGLPDQGKTLLFCDVAARLTTGSPMPPAPRSRQREPQRALILTLEDSLAATIVPRLDRAGADRELIDFVRMVRQPDGSTSLLTLAEDLDVLGAALEAKRYALVVVDGITGYLGADARTHNDADVRRVLSPFSELLERARVAGLSVMHPPKAITNLAYYAGGSVAFTAIPRVTLGVAPDPEDESESPRRLLVKLKGNLYGSVPTLAYHIRADGPADVPWLEWEPDPVRVNLADVLDPVRESPEDRGARRSCEAWLRSYLADGARASKDVEKAAAEAGFTKATLRRARERVVDTVKRGQPGQAQQWEWLLRPLAGGTP